MSYICCWKWGTVGHRLQTYDSSSLSVDILSVFSVRLASLICWGDLHVNHGENVYGTRDTMSMVAS